jgi:GDP-L-fucose synthase
MFKEKNVLIAGGSGLIGHQLVKLLIQEGANVVVADLKKSFNKNIEYMPLDLTVYENCVKATKNIDYVFNLLCAKGSPKSMRENPVSHYVPMILFDTNLMKAAHQNKVKGYMYTSTLGVYGPAEVFYEDDVWKTFPSKNDRFAGWAKRMGELQTEAYQIQYGWDNVCIVRPANTYGPYDDFHSERSMVIPSIVKKVCTAQDNKIKVWGDGR